MNPINRPQTQNRPQAQNRPQTPQNQIIIGFLKAPNAPNHRNPDAQYPVRILRGDLINNPNLKYIPK